MSNLDQVARHTHSGNTLPALIAYLAVAICLWGCPDQPTESAAPSSKPIVIKFWHTFNASETETVLTLVNEFEEKNPSIEVEVTVLSFGSARNKLLDSVVRGQGPDIARAEVAWIPELAAADLLTDLSAQVRADEHIEQSHPFMTFKGKIVAFPQSVDCLVLFYNRAHLSAAGESPPAHLDDLVRISRKLTIDTAGRHSLHPEFSPSSVKVHGLHLRGDGYTFLPFLWASGGRTLDPESGQVFIADKAAVAAAKYVRDLRLRHRVIPDKVDFANDYRDEIEAFRNGSVSMIVNGPWATEEILLEGVFTDATNLGIAPVPRGKSGEGGSPVGGHGYVVPKSAAHPDAAEKLGLFLSGRHGQLVLATKNNILPTRKALYDEPTLKSNPRVGAFRLALEQAHDRAVFPGMARMFDALTPAVQRIIVAEAEPGAVLTTVAKEWTAIIER